MSADSEIYRYHDSTKHHFNRYARSLGYLDWASQPRPFRSYEGAPRFPLPPDPTSGIGHLPERPVTWSKLFDDAGEAATPLSCGFLGGLLRYSLGLSAWKVAGASRWALRVNPSSGNLHPTEAYVIGPVPDTAMGEPAVCHYAPDAHALERRCVFSLAEWRALTEGSSIVLVALTSIHWREAWKYGERAFRYCQHDLGHAIAALAIAARVHGWRAELLPGWSHAQAGAVTGADRDADFFEAEREEPGCVMAVVPAAAQVPESLRSGAALAAAVARGHWVGRASQLSEDHIEWASIDEIAAATRSGGDAHFAAARVRMQPDLAAASAVSAVTPVPADVRGLLLQRRSAVAFDGRAAIEAEAFFAMLSRLLPDGRGPWSALWWPPRIHLLLFVHRVTGVEPGLYLFARSASGGAALREACGRDFVAEPAHSHLPLTRLAVGDCRGLARRLSCDQNIAADGFFSLGMIAEFAAPLIEEGASSYRRLFWESGVVGQMLYLEAEAAGIRGTGIGCFFDDAVHEVMGLQGHAFQSLYHFTVGAPVEDVRLLMTPGYEWELPGVAASTTTGMR
ncbi:MAG: SagB/ThcOx family dehydrogenase [Vicinamibacterales bacterium]